MKKPTVSLKRIEQEIDLEELFGVDLSDDDSLKEALAQTLIDKMVTRVQDGQGIGGVKLKSPYSERYAKTLEFKAAGKSRGKVNMTLTGDMVSSIGVISTKGNTIKIGIEDSEQVAKAYNHQTGDTVPQRPFFGFSKDELNDIKKEFSSKIKRAAKEGAGAKDGLALELIDSIEEDDDF